MSNNQENDQINVSDVLARAKAQGTDLIIHFTGSCAPYCNGEFAKVSADWAQAYLAKGVAQLGPDGGSPKPRDKSGDWANVQGRTANGSSRHEAAIHALSEENTDLKGDLKRLTDLVEALTKNSNVSGGNAAPVAKAQTSAKA
jgi:hypothetical protein